MHCPYCNGPLEKNRANFISLSAKQRVVFDAIVAAGVDGIKQSALQSRFFPTSSDITIRVFVCYINKKIAPLHIKSHGKMVRLDPVH